MKTNVVFSKEARVQIMSGADKAAAAVGCTLGPKGKTVLIVSQDEKEHVLTKDGVTVSKAISFKNQLERVGADLLRSAAVKTNELAGDGTTTVTVLAHSLMTECNKLIEAGVSRREMCLGLEVARDEIISQVVAMSKKIDKPSELENIASISANNDRALGTIVVDALSQVGADGVVTVEESKSMRTYVEKVQGTKIPCGYVSPYFVTDQVKMNASFNDCLVFITDKKMSSLEDIVHLLEVVRSKSTSTPLLIIADDIVEEALQVLILNRTKINMPVVAVRAPAYGAKRVELLKDLCALTGAKLFSANTGLVVKNVSLKDLGTTTKVIVDAKSTLLTVSTFDQAAQEHIQNIRDQIESDPTLDASSLEFLKTRLAGMTSGAATIKVGGLTSLEAVEKLHRIEDALCAARAAAEDGIVPGGGSVLALVAAKLRNTKVIHDKDQKFGYEALLSACEAPLRKIALNAGVSPDIIVNNVVSTGETWNAMSGQYVNDPISAGIVDPVRVTVCAVRNAVSTAVSFVNIDAVVTSDD
jgi:chaperonin GroEL